jgi:diguanylate cyclase (GGDEF)-like protein
VAKTIAAKCNQADDLAARYGGEEFVILLPNTAEAQAQQVANRIMDAIARICIEHRSSEVNQCVTLSLGLATKLPEENMDSEQLIEKADQALYRAKADGRNRLVLASSL